MRLRLYLDDCIDSTRLNAILRECGHEVVRPRDAGLVGALDRRHFAYACEHELILLTANPRDFEPLHKEHPAHPGILAVCQDGDARDMRPDEIARAIQNVVDASAPIIGQLVVLNHWRY